MSLISTFWTLDKTKLSELLVEAKPRVVKVGKRPFLPFAKQKTETIYPWFDYLSQNAVQEIAYDSSGMVMSDFDLMLSEHGGSLFALSMPESNEFSACCGGSAALLDHAAAQTIISNISRANFSIKDVASFYDADQKPDEWRFDEHEVIRAGEHIKLWCERVTQDKIGILVIG